MKTNSPIPLRGFLCAAILLASSLANATDAALESKVENILKQMTLEEKAAMCLGASGTEFKGVPRLGIPNMSCVDGPRGPHGPGGTTAFPVGVAFGATWNPELIGQAAEVIGKETRALGIPMLLGPSLNILRDPLGGRFFEYYTEDPYLNARLITAFVKGVQNQKVATCLKHFACNNREDNRNFYMSMVDPRTLNEIYFPGFKAGVQEGGAWAVMTAANGTNGEFCSDSKYLLNDTLKRGWGFDGMVLTDWLGSRSTEKAAFAGLDVSMPFQPESKFGDPLLQAVKSGKVPETVIDDKVRRVLRTMGRVGLLDREKPESGGERNTREHYDLSRRVAEDSIVLLKNTGHLLPLDAASLHNILVVGPNANRRFCLTGLGGSSWQESEYEVTPLEGIRKAVGGGTEVRYFSVDELGGFQIIPSSVMEKKDGEKGFLARYFNAGSKDPSAEQTIPEINFLWEMKSPAPDKVQPENFRARFSGTLIPPVTGTYTLRITSNGGPAEIYVDPEGGAPLAVNDPAKGIPSATGIVQMQARKPFFLRVDYTKTVGDSLCRLEWALPSDEKKTALAFEKLENAAKAADAVLVFAGLDHSLDAEGRDRTDMSFPESQQTLIKQLAQANPKTIVTLINGSPVELGGWIDKVPAVLEAWYPGMEGGNAIANVLFGKVNPSGKLPFTWPKKLADSPAHSIGTETNDRVDYKEGVFVGYRYFDTKNIAPEFPFGHGLSYTDFDYSDLKLTPHADGATATITVKNTGEVAGSETVQWYVSESAPVIERPVHELKAFRKVSLAPGESKDVVCELGPEAFSYFDPASGRWTLHPGWFEIQAGSSSRDIRQRGKVLLPAK